ncbi:MAG: asparagine synthase-related protein, partial [Arenicellales bacterium]
LKGLGGDGLKHILRKTASRYLPKDLIYREKQGFGFPIARWMRTDLNHFLTNLFKESRFVELGIFRQEVIDQYLKEHLEGISDHNFRLWILLNLEMWYRIYFEEMDMDAMNALTDRLMRAA